MVIATLTESEREGSKHWSRSTLSPDWPEIVDAITRLDGHEHTLLTLDTPEHSYMAIGGGANGRYTVQATFNWGDFVAMVHPDIEGDDQIIMAGQPKSCPAKAIVNREEALKAARAFAMLGALDAAAAWETI